MVPSSSGSADTRADKDNGTCLSVSLCLRTTAAQTARPAASIATLHCGQTSLPQTHGRPLHRPPAHQAPAFIRESGQETEIGGVGHRLLLVQHQAPQGGNNARPASFEPPSVPRVQCICALVPRCKNIRQIRTVDSQSKNK